MVEGRRQQRMELSSGSEVQIRGSDRDNGLYQNNSRDPSGNSVGDGPSNAGSAKVSDGNIANTAKQETFDISSSRPTGVVRDAWREQFDCPGV